MPILSPDQKAAIAAEIAKPAYAGKTPAQIADMLNAATTAANPAAQGQVPRDIDDTELLSLITNGASFAALNDHPSLPTIIEAIDSGANSKVRIWATLLGAGGKITQAEAQAIVAYVSATVPDPAYQATITGPNWVQANFPGAVFTMPDGSSFSGQVSAAIIAEALS